jgi:sulfite reductase (NADPH) flavoprotein alpha-component
LLEKLRGPVNADQRSQILREAHVIDLLRDQDAANLGTELVNVLRPLAPRLYSVASSAKVHRGEVHLLVDVVRFERRGHARTGVFSGQIKNRLEVGATLRAFVQKAPGFSLVAPDKDIVMIGPGTGVAPFRAFLEERAHAKQVGPIGRSWLFFGARNRANDFFYEADFDEMTKSGVLTELSLAFSRDQAEKIYVQDRMRERRADLVAWVAAGATIYVCGDAKRMAPDVHAALQDILGAETLAKLTEENRYRRDVY